ncbi:substrate-binding periplasmic protein [Aestuariirhabdus litorea]|nr:transporter substrate-binding domain-containing protein [Aestuariirhabdus litorea]
MPLSLRCCLLLLVACLSGPAWAESRLLFAYGKHDGPPHAFMSERAPRELQGGILFDIGMEIGRRLEVRVGFVEVPRPRLPSWLEEGKVHAHCQLNPEWVDVPQQLLWSHELFSTADRFYLAGSRSENVHRHEDLKGMRLGAIRGYTYSEPLTRLVNSGAVQREDASSTQQLVQMLVRGRIEALLTDEIVADYLLSLQPYDIAGAPLEDARQGRFCAYSAKAPIPFERFNEVVRAMIDEGRVREIINQYR